MNKLIIGGRILECNYIPAEGMKKSRASIRIVLFRKGGTVEIQCVAFEVVADFMARGQGLIPDKSGKYLPLERRCFYPGCHIEGSAYVTNQMYADNHGVERDGCGFILEEANSEPLDEAGRMWLKTYKRQTVATSTPKSAANNADTVTAARTWTPASAVVRETVRIQTQPQMKIPVQIQTPTRVQTQAQLQQTHPQVQAQVQQSRPQTQVQAQVQQANPQVQAKVQTQATQIQGGFQTGIMPGSVPGIPSGGFRPGTFRAQSGAAAPMK